MSKSGRVTESGALQALWTWRRWAYGAYMVVAVSRIPARTGFHLSIPRCDTAVSFTNIGLSLTKVPHVVLFALFFFVTALQFDRLDRRALAWSVGATAALGLLVELEEGATGTGYCRLTDVLPDVFGALIGTVVLASVIFVRVHSGRSRARAVNPIERDTRNSRI